MLCWVVYIRNGFCSQRWEFPYQKWMEFKRAGSIGSIDMCLRRIFSGHASLLKRFFFLQRNSQKVSIEFEYFQYFILKNKKKKMWPILIEGYRPIDLKGAIEWVTWIPLTTSLQVYLFIWYLKEQKPQWKGNIWRKKYKSFAHFRWIRKILDEHSRDLSKFFFFCTSQCCPNVSKILRKFAIILFRNSSHNFLHYWFFHHSSITERKSNPGRHQSPISEAKQKRAGPFTVKPNEYNEPDLSPVRSRIDNFNWRANDTYCGTLFIFFSVHCLPYFFSFRSLVRS